MASMLFMTLNLQVNKHKLNEIRVFARKADELCD